MADVSAFDWDALCEKARELDERGFFEGARQDELMCSEEDCDE